MSAHSDAHPAAASGRTLGRRAKDLLDFERDWTGWQGDKEGSIRARFAISPARYYQLLSRLVDDPAARAYDPLVIARLRRRRRERLGRRAHAEPGRRPGR